jgi:hypothetical protein
MLMLLVQVGYMFDMETSLARTAFDKLGLNYDAVFFGHTCLNETSINALLQLNLGIAVFQVGVWVGWVVRVSLPPACVGGWVWT